MRAAAPPGYEHQVERLDRLPRACWPRRSRQAIGACFLEYGFERTAEAVAEAFEPQIEFAIANLYDFKSELQERLARRGEVVVYRVVSEEGPPHDRLFETVAEVDGRTLGSGSGRSKKESEQEAARTALEHSTRSEAARTTSDDSERCTPCI